MSRMEEIDVKIDNDNDVYKDKTDNGNDKPHNGEPFSFVGVTPDEKYLVTRSYNDTIAYWNVEDVNNDQLKSEFEHKSRFREIMRFHYKKVALYDSEFGLRNYDIMNKEKQEIELGYNISQWTHIFTFNLKGEFISINHDRIPIYSTQTKNNKWNLKRMYKISEYFNDFFVISITRDSKFYLYSNNSIYEFDLITERSIKLLFIHEELESIMISSNENLVCLIINKTKIIFYSVELKIPITSLDMYRDVNQLRKHMKNPDLCFQLFPLLLSLYNESDSAFGEKSIMKNIWEKCLEHLKREEKASDIQVINNYAFVILDKGIWRIDLKKIISSINTFFINDNDDNDDNDGNDMNNNVETYDNLHFLNSYMETIRELFQDVIKNYDQSDGLKLTDQSRNLYRWNISHKVYNKEFTIELNVSKNNNHNYHNYRCEKAFHYNLRKEYDGLRYNYSSRGLGVKLLNDSNIIILSQVGLLIYHFNEYDKSISLNYYYHMKLGKIVDKEFIMQIEPLQNCKKVFSKNNLPPPNYESFEFCKEWLENVKDNKVLFLKYGVKLLKWAIKKRKIELVNEIYKKCFSLFKEDLNNNKMFLSIITSTMPLLNEYYPEYIERYSLETTMIVDSSSYSIEYQNKNLHLSSQYPLLVNLSRSIYYYNYQLLIKELEKSSKKVVNILNFIQSIIILLIFPIYFATFYILSKFNFFNNILTKEVYFNFYFKVVKFFSKYEGTKSIPMLIFMNPYIKFTNYPKDYDWFMELFKPQPSPFVKTINSDIYKSWSGESLIIFKWNKYGKYYYAIIWIIFTIFLGCFTAAATIPHIDDNVRNKLLITSIILGFIHLSFEIRQFIYNPIKWFRDFWNLFDVIAYALPIYTSIRWLQTNEMIIIPLLSFSCLFLDIKFLLFFRAFEYFGVYFAIIISVATQIISFLVVLFIIMMSFAHAFYILLIPRSQFSFDQRTNSNDPNNPWNLVTVYNQVFENGTMDSNPYIIQPPNENTNMFVDFKTALFATYNFLAGDSSAFSNWTYMTNPALAILIILFSLLIVIYLMNLFIGLLNNAIEKDNNRVSYLIQKAEILIDIELFYLLPHQRRWETWFPEIIYYYANVDKTREKVKEMIKNGEWNTEEFKELKEDLMKKLHIKLTSKESSLQNMVVEYI